MKKGRIWILVAIIVMVAIGGALWNLSSGDTGRSVIVESPKRANITEIVNATGEIQPEVSVKISPDVSGEIVELYVAMGDQVKKDQLLCKIRQDNFISQLDRAQGTLDAQRAGLLQAQAQVSSARASLKRAEADYQRNQALFRDKVISEAEFQGFEATYRVAEQNVQSALQTMRSAEFNLKAAQATVTDAAENLRKTVIRSPIDGYVLSLAVEKGERVVGTLQMTGTEMMTIGARSELAVVANISENDILKIKLRDSARITLDAMPDRVYAGLVSEISDSPNKKLNADQVTEFRVKVKLLTDVPPPAPASSRSRTVASKDQLPKMGMTAMVEIVHGRGLGVLAIPIASVMAVGDTADDKPLRNQGFTEKVMIYEKGAVAYRGVRTGLADFEQIEIREGLTERDSVIVGPYEILTNPLPIGETVKRQNEKKGRRERS